MTSDTCKTMMRLQEIAVFHWALFNYYYRRWDQALGIIEVLNDNMPRKIYELYIERIEQLRHQELDDNWDGVFTHTSK